MSALNPPQRVSRDRRDHSEITYEGRRGMCIREFYRGRKKCKYKLEIRHLRCCYCVRYDGLDVDPRNRQQNQFQGRSSLHLFFEHFFVEWDIYQTE